MLAKVQSLCLQGVAGVRVDVEVYVTNGMPDTVIVGLPDAAVKESRDRVRAALLNAGFGMPPKHVVISLAPADIRKEGPAFDLPIAVGLLIANGIVPQAAAERTLFLGELALDGSVRTVRGALAMVIAARERGYADIVLPADNAQEAAYVDGVTLRPAAHLRRVVQHLQGTPIPPMAALSYRDLPAPQPDVDLADVRGLHGAKRALEVAAAGGHNLLMIGAPGGGKTLLAKALPGILPDMTLEEALEATQIRSVSGESQAGEGLMMSRTLSKPHHTASKVALVGGGQHVLPGAISKAHNGVLFLDEFAEFQRDVLEAMRQPLEDGEVTIARANAQVTYPSRAMLVCAMNPCPCGHYGSPKTSSCRCSPKEIQRYLSRISGPLLDRIDMHIEIEAVSVDVLLEPGAVEESSAAVRARVNRARQRQNARFAGQSARCNAQMEFKPERDLHMLSPDVQRLLRAAREAYDLSTRAITRVVKVALTIADLAQCDAIDPEHIAEAIQYRTLDEKYWG